MPRFTKTFFIFSLFLCYTSVVFAEGMPPTLVETTTAHLQPWQKEINATGTLSANQGIMVKPDTDGRITKIYFKSGQMVNQGDPLLELNPNVLKASLQYANAQLALSTGDLSRAQDLFKKKAMSAAELDKALANYNSAKANADKAQAQLDMTVVKAPFSGRLGLSLINLGDYLTTGQNIVSLQAVDPMRVDFSIPEVYLNDIALGQTIYVRSHASLNKTYVGTVYAFDSLVNVNTRSLALRGSIPNQDQKLIPGSFAEVKLLAGSKENLVTIPLVAVMNSADGDYVYRVVDNHAIKTPVKMGQRNGTDVTILNGLATGDVVIIAGQIKVHDGAPVMVKPASRTA